MNYEFTLDKKAVVSLIAGSLVIGILLFAAGWIVGMQWSPDSSPSSASATAKKEEAELPKEPVLKDEAPASRSAPPKSIHLPVDQPNKTVPAAPEAVAALSTEAPAAANGEVKIIEEEAADPANPESTGEPEYVTVQIGVFLNEQEASRLLKQVERKGYAPTFFSARDAEARQWYAVRIGSYSDKQQAANAAANFKRQEKIEAVVRPLGSL
jgi:septal ring-binding cell division protein DamX